MDADPRADAPGGRPDPAESPWRTLATRHVYSNPWLSLTEYEVIRPDGQRGIYGIVDPGPNATIVALDEHEQVRLVGDFVYPLQRHMWGLPSGKIEENETTARPDGTERFTLRALPLREALDACLRGELRSAVTVLGIWRAWAYLHGID